MKFLPLNFLVLFCAVLYTSVSGELSAPIQVCKSDECSYAGGCITGHSNGKKFKAKDGCNDCWCYPDGTFACTRRYCIPKDRCPGGGEHWWRKNCVADSQCTKGYFCHKGACCPNPFCPRLNPRILVRCSAPPDQCENCHHCCPGYCGPVCLTSLPNQGVNNLVCPSIPNNMGGICLQGCTDDASCKHPQQKCCSNGCGNVCMAGERKYHQKCPKIVLNPTKPCVEAQFLCPKDGCKDDEKGPRVCCPTTCGNGCISMSEITGPN